jgi:type II secretory pathway pseudopilin PulG
MASRQEEKEQRRRERLEAEQAAQRSASRKRMLTIGGGAVLVLAVIAAIAVVALAGGDDKSANTSSLAADAKAAGCTFNSYRSEGRNHTTGKVKYKTNPPTSGSHNPTPAQDGLYAPGNEPAPENAVHSLEHGRIEFQYKPGTSKADVAKFRKLAEEELNGTPGYHVLMFQNNTKMPTQFALVAWTKSLTCDTLDAKSMDVMRQFRKAYTDKGPELIP